MVTAINAMIHALLGCPKNGSKRANRWRKVLFTATDALLAAIKSDESNDCGDAGVEFVTVEGADFA
jgi:hypothetical protein